MADIAVMSDTNASLDFLEGGQSIGIVRSIIYLGETAYTDTLELSATQFYDALANDPSIMPKTAQPPMHVMIEAYKKLRDQGAKDIIFVTISSQMSGIYNTAKIAAKEVQGVRVHVFDSKSVAYPQARMAIRADALARDGQTLESIMETLEAMRERNHIYFAVDTLKYLVKNGRLSGAQGFMGSMLRIKPLLEITPEGSVESIEKIRTFKRALQGVIDRYIQRTEHLDNVKPFICHANNPEAVETITAALKAHDETLGDIPTLPLTPAVGAHAGPGAIGLGYLLEP